MIFGFVGWIVLILILILGAIAVAYGAGGEFKDLMISWGMGLVAILVVAIIGGLLMLWSTWIGLIFFAVAALYILDRMLKS